MGMELHVRREGDEISFEGKGSVNELKTEAREFVKDIDTYIVGPRLKQLTEDLKPYVGR